MAHKILELAQGMEKGGRTKRIAETAIGLKRHGWEVKVLSMTPVPDWVKTRYQGSVDWLDLQRRNKLDLQYLLRLARLIKSERIALIHAHCEGSYFYGGLAGKICKVPVVGTYHRSDLSYFKRHWKLRLLARLLTRAVAISNDRMNLIQSNLNINPQKTTLIHGGINLDSFQLLPSEEIQRLKQDFGLQAKRILLSIGHLGPIKGHQITLQALPQVLEKFPDVIWVVAGDGTNEDYERLNREIKKLGVADSVKLLGQAHNVIEWLNICDLFVQPSIEEGFGLVFVEAGACKKAVVATAVGGIKDIVVNGETGLLIAPNDADALAEAINTLLADPAKAADFAEAGFRRVYDYFSMDAMVEKYHSLFAELLATEQDPRA